MYGCQANTQKNHSKNRIFISSISTLPLNCCFEKAYKKRLCCCSFHYYSFSSGQGWIFSCSCCLDMELVVMFVMCFIIMLILICGCAGCVYHQTNTKSMHGNDSFLPSFIVALVVFNENYLLKGRRRSSLLLHHMIIIIHRFFFVTNSPFCSLPKANTFTAS